MWTTDGPTSPKVFDEIGVRAALAEQMGSSRSRPGLAASAHSARDGQSPPDDDAILIHMAVLGSTFAAAVISTDGVILQANALFGRLFGFALAELTGRTHAHFLRHNEWISRERSAVWARLREGKAQAFTCPRLHKDGSELWIRALAIPVLEPDGRLRQVLEISVDITAQYHQSIDDRGQVDAINTSQAVIQFDVDGTILDANAKFLGAVGYSAGEVVGQHHRIFVDEAYARSAEYQAFWSDLSAGRHHAAEFCRRGKDGRIVWLQATYNPIFDAEGRLRKIVKYAIDVTEEKLRRADYEWQIAAIHKSHAVITFDMHGIVLDANETFLQAMGYPLDEIQGRHHRMFVDPSSAHGADYAAFWDSLRHGCHQAGQYRRRGKGGREVWLQATYNPVFDMDGRPVKVVKFATVVTQEKLRQAEQQGQIAAIHKAQCVIAFDLDGVIVDANDNFLDAMGYRLAEVIGRHHSMFVEPDVAQSPTYIRFWAELAQGRHQASEYKRLGKDGREVWLQATYNPIFDMSGRAFKVVKYATDVTAEKLRQADHQGQIAAIQKSQGVMSLAMDGTILGVNANFLATLGYRADEVEGRHHRMLVEPGHADSDEYKAFWTTLRQGSFVSNMYKRVGKGGRAVWIQASYNPILDLNGRPFKVVKFATDVTGQVALAEAYEDAKRQAQQDSVTSLPNRIRLATFMDAVLAHADRRLVVLYLDIDRFKPINDTFGHPTGDRVLGEIADRLRRALDNDQLAARVGGDEFVIAAPDLPDEGIEPLCQSLLSLVSAPILHDGIDLTVTLSIGIAVSQQDGATSDELLRCADIALLRAKRDGGGTFSFFASTMSSRIAAYRGLVDDMRRGLAEGEFFLEFQPRYALQTLTMRSVEALVRWSHPERGRISPADFIPLAERSGLIVPLGEWVLRTACRTAARWDGIGVSVNVSPVQFRTGDMVASVNAALAETGLDAHKLELEITEGVLLEDAARARAMLNRLKALGVKLAMDDFGTGFSSLGSLRSFPFDVIKIDRQFITDIDEKRGRAVVQAILGLGRALGMSVTAEGVETERQLSALTDDLCDEVQGYLLGRPMSAAAIDALLAGVQPSAPVADRPFKMIGRGA